MTDPSENIVLMQRLTFFGVEHVEGGKGGEGGYRLYPLFHLCFAQIRKMSSTFFLLGVVVQIRIALTKRLKALQAGLRSQGIFIEFGRGNKC